MEWETPSDDLKVKRAIAKRISKQTVEELQPILDKLLKSRGKPLLFIQKETLQKLINSLKLRIKNIKTGG